MKKNSIIAILLMLSLALMVSIPIAFSGYYNSNGDNGYDGTNKASNELPDQSNVPAPAGFIEDILGAPQVVEGCRAEGGNIALYEPGLGIVYGGPCCKGPYLFDIEGEPVYAPNQCCNPPDIIYSPDEYTPGNHCLCFIMRWVGPPPF